MVYPRVHDPVLYEWNVNETHTRYDYPRAWPSHTKLHVEFAVLATINAVTATFVFLLIIAILRSRRVRKGPFNLYLLFIAIPDFMVSFLCFFTCALSAPQREYFSEWMCGFQSFYLNWSFISNAWLNGMIVYQIHKMLRQSNVRHRYTPPTHARVMMHAACVYTYAAFWGFLCGFNLEFLPHSSHLYYGFACMPMEYNMASTLFFWLVYIPFTLGLPLLYAVYVLVDIIKNKLLPPTGKRRALTMFLLRLCFLYFAVWFPFLVLFLVGNFVVINPLIHWTGAAISHLQGLFSAVFCLTNEDIRRSFILVVKCQPAWVEDEDQTPASSGPSADLSIELAQSTLFPFWRRRESRTGRSQMRQSTCANVGSGTSGQISKNSSRPSEEARGGRSQLDNVQEEGVDEEKMARTVAFDKDPLQDFRSNVYTTGSDNDQSQDLPGR